MDAAQELGPGVLVAERYRIEELIGRGGMGTIWKATDETLDRLVAIKCVRLDDRADADRALTRERTLREARIAAKLHHPTIVAIFDIIERDDPWLVLEYVPSRSLADILDEHGTLPPADVATIGAQIAAALATAHRAGVVHRDVKPGNILIGDRPEDGDPLDRPTAKLTDFGISHAANSPTLTATGLLTGTPAYFAPETARGEGTDARTDVYSLGATLYAASEGHPPFGTDPGNLLALLARIGRGGAPAPEHAGPLTELLHRLLHDDPDSRPTAAQAHTELQQVAAAAPAPHAHTGHVPETVDTEPSPSTSAPTTRLRPPWRRVLVGGLVIAALIASGAVITTHPGTPQVPPTPTAAPPAPSAITIGDPQTADPCSLVDLSALRSHGNPRIVWERSGFAGCTTLVRDGITLHISFLSPEETGRFGAEGLLPTTGGVPDRLGALIVERHASTDESCQRRLRLSDGNTVTIYATPAQPGVEGMCDIAESATAAAADILHTKGVGARAQDRALAGIDACSLLQPTDLEAVLGLVDVVTLPGFGNWRCTFDDPAARTTAARVAFGRGQPFWGAQVDVDGMPVGLSITPGQRCDAYISYSTKNASLYFDFVRVEAFGSGPDTELCDHAWALANAVVARLPRPA
jgi:serine/threonine protein kinase